MLPQSSLPALENPLPRTRLKNLLDLRGTTGLTFLSAPAGYGKSWLVASWLKENQLAYAWLTLNTTHTAHTVFTQLAQSLLPALQNSTIPIPAIETPTHLWIHWFYQQLQTLSQPFIFVVDNYQLNADPELNNALAQLLTQYEHIFSLIIISRHLPPPAWSQLFAAEDSLLLDEQNLRFPKEEVDALFYSSPIQHYFSASEWSYFRHVGYYFLQGWPALTQLFFHSSAENYLPKETFFTRLPHSVIDFFMAEIVDTLTIEERSFLTEMGWLAAISTYACSEQPGNTQLSLLDPLINKNLLKPNQENKSIFHPFHPQLKLFCAYLYQQQKPTLSTLTENFSLQWFAREKYAVYLIESLAYQHNKSLCAEALAHTSVDFYAAELEFIIDWIVSQLKSEDLSAYPQLLNKLRLYYLSRQQIYYCGKVFSAEMADATARNSWLTQQVTQPAPLELLFARSIVSLSNGQLMEAQQSSHQMISQSIQDQRIMPLLRGLIILSKICQLTGDYAPLIQALQFTSSSAFAKKGRSPILTLSQLAMIPYYLAKGEYAKAQSLLKEIRLCLDQTASLNIYLLEHEWHLCQAKYQLSQTQLAGLDDLLKCIKQMEQQLCEEYLQLDIDSCSLELWAQLLQNKTPNEWPETFHNNEGADKLLSPAKGWQRFYTAHLLQKKEVSQQAIDDLLLLREQAKIQQYKLFEVIANFYLALAEQKRATCIDYLSPALSWCAQKKFYGLVLCQGSELLTLLEKAKKLPELNSFITQVETLNRSLTHAEWQPNTTHIIAKLSKREREILQLIAEGLSNEKIAAQLHRSIGTIKLHAHNLYQKINAANRIEATRLLREYNELNHE